MKRTRLLLLGAMLTLLAAASWIPVSAQTCQQVCLSSDNRCLTACNPDTNPSYRACRDMCQLGFTECNARCLG
jgi:hypothetical protein